MEISNVLEKLLDRYDVVCAGASGRTTKRRLHVVTLRPLGRDERRELAESLPGYNVKDVYIEDLKLSLQGYGFVSRQGIIDVSPLSPDDLTVFTTYRQRLVEYAAPGVSVAGNAEMYEAFMEAARQALASVVITNVGSAAFSTDEFQQALRQLSADFDLDTPNALEHLVTNFLPLLDTFVQKGWLQKQGERYRVKSPKSFRLEALKPYEQFKLEQQYLGVHESNRSWAEFMSQVGKTGLPTYQTERPLTYQTPSQLKARTATPLPRHGEASVETLLTEMAGLVEPFSINQSTANFTAFPEAGNSKAGVAAAMLSPLWNQNLISVDKSAPIATFMEVQVIEWLRQLVGYDCVPVESALNMGGVTATGGVMANTIGLLMARSIAFPEARSTGLSSNKKKPFLLVADKTLEHYSHKAGFWWLGLGEDNVIPVKANGYKFDIKDLRQKIATYNSGDNVVVAVVCLAGDSRTLTIQNVADIHNETSKHGIWLHLDACQGGVALFASNRKELCEDYKLADSISIDPHKGLGVPYSSSFCLFKDQNILQHIAKSTDITIAKGSYDIGQVTPFLGSRPFDALKFWALMKYHGLDGLAQNVDYRIGLTKKWAVAVNASKSFVALNEPELTAISLSVDPHKTGLNGLDAATLSRINKAVHDRCYQAGWFVIHCFDLIDFENHLGIPEQVPLRVLGTNFGNVLLDEYHFPKFLAYMEDQLQAVLREERARTHGRQSATVS